MQNFETSSEKMLIKNSKMANISTSDLIPATNEDQIKNMWSSNNDTLEDINMLPDIFSDADFSMDFLNFNKNQTSDTYNKNNISLPSWDTSSFSSSSSDGKLVRQTVYINLINYRHFKRYHILLNIHDYEPYII